MKFIRVFALLFALVAVLSGAQNLLSDAVLDIGSVDSVLLNLVEIAVGLSFAAGAYFVTTDPRTSN